MEFLVPARERFTRYLAVARSGSITRAEYYSARFFEHAIHGSNYKQGDKFIDEKELDHFCSSGPADGSGVREVREQ